MELEWLDSDGLACEFAQGNRDAFAEVWRRYHERMNLLTAWYLRRQPKVRNSCDYQDIVGESMLRLIELAAQGKLHLIDSRDGFWTVYRKVLVQVLVDQLNRLSAQKRGGKWIHAEGCDLDLLDSGLPRPDVLAVGVELMERLFRLLKPEDQFIAGLRLDGFHVREIAETMGKPVQTIERRLTEIRRRWDESGFLG
jgi:DNA-directed RNA polymerase specialized sigma24 family protein